MGSYVPEGVPLFQIIPAPFAVREKWEFNMENSSGNGSAEVSLDYYTTYQAISRPEYIYHSGQNHNQYSRD